MYVCFVTNKMTVQKPTLLHFQGGGGGWEGIGRDIVLGWGWSKGRLEGNKFNEFEHSL